MAACEGKADLQLEIRGVSGPAEPFRQVGALRGAPVADAGFDPARTVGGQVVQPIRQLAIPPNGLRERSDAITTAPAAFLT